MINFEAARRFERGQREKFAISAIFDEGFENYYFIGRFTFFIESKQFGDWEAFSDLAAGARWARTYLKKREQRDSLDVAGLEPLYLIWRLYGRDFSPGAPRGDQSLIQAPDGYGTKPYISGNEFSLITIGESSTRDSAVVLAIPQPDGTDRILGYEHDTEEIGDATVDSEEVIQIISDFVQWVEGLGKLEGQRK